MDNEKNKLWKTIINGFSTAYLRFIGNNFPSDPFQVLQRQIKNRGRVGQGA